MIGWKVSAMPVSAQPRQCRRLAAAALAIVLMAPAAAFASAQISGSQQAVSVDAQNTSIKEVLSALGQKFKLQLQSSANLDKPISGTYQGSLQHVVARLLEGYNFFIRTNQGALEVTVLGTPNAPTTAGVQSASVIIPAPATQAHAPATLAQMASPQRAEKPKITPASQAAAVITPSPTAQKAPSSATAKPSPADSAAPPLLVKVAEGPMPVPGKSTASGPVPGPATATMPTPTPSGKMPSIAPTPATNPNGPALPMPTGSKPFPGISGPTNQAPAAPSPSAMAPTPTAPSQPTTK